MCNDELIWIVMLMMLLGCGCDDGCTTQRGSCGAGGDIVPLLLVLMLLGKGSCGLGKLFGDDCCCTK